MPIVRAFFLSVPLLIGLALFTAFNPKVDFWGAVESPKAQCEAYDAQRLKVAERATSMLYSPQKLDRMIREPQNTVSNLAYCSAGLAILFAARKTLSRSLGFSSIFLGLGSGFYHASLLPEWRLVDILGVYVVLFSLVGLGLAAVVCSRFSERKGLAIAAGIWLCAFVAGIFRNDVRILGFKLFDSTYVVVGMVFFGFLLGLIASRKTRDRKRYWTAFAFLSICSMVAFTGGLGDRFGGFWADPEGPIQGHAVWHTFGALALLSAYEVFSRTGFDGSLFARTDKSIGAG